MSGQVRASGLSRGDERSEKGSSPLPLSPFLRSSRFHNLRKDGDEVLSGVSNGLLGDDVPF